MMKSKVLEGKDYEDKLEILIYKFYKKIPLDISEQQIWDYAVQRGKR